MTLLPGFSPSSFPKGRAGNAGPEQTHGPTCLSWTWPAWHSGTTEQRQRQLLPTVFQAVSCARPGDSGRKLRAGRVLVTVRPPSPRLLPQHRDTASPRYAWTCPCPREMQMEEEGTAQSRWQQRKAGHDGALPYTGLHVPARPSYCLDLAGQGPTWKTCRPGSCS